MKCNRANTTLTFSAALAGLALAVLTPAAYGHGNNPKTTDTEPDTNLSPPTPPPPPPPPTSDGPRPNTDDNVRSMAAPEVLELILDPGIVIGFDRAIQDSFNLLSRVVSEPVAISMIVDPAADLAPQIAVELSVRSGSGSISVPMSNVIPAPGTLALLGLAAASAGRRRRRRRP